MLIHPKSIQPNWGQFDLCQFVYVKFIYYILSKTNEGITKQLLTGNEGNIWYVGPEDKMLPEAFCIILYANNYQRVHIHNMYDKLLNKYDSGWFSLGRWIHLSVMLFSICCL